MYASKQLHPTPKARIAVAIALLALVLGPALLAGPPLLCPGTVFTDAEKEALDEIAKDAPIEAKVQIVAQLLERNTGARFHGETIRWFYRAHSKAFPALRNHLVAVVEQRKGVPTVQERFDRVLADLLSDYSGDDAIARALDLSALADASGDPALLLYAAEANDLVWDSSPLLRRTGSLLSLAHCRRVVAAIEQASPDDATMQEVARLFAVHLPYLRGMHGEDADWDAFLDAQEARIEGEKDQARQAR